MLCGTPVKTGSDQLHLLWRLVNQNVTDVYHLKNSYLKEDWFFRSLSLNSLWEL